MDNLLPPLPGSDQKTLAENRDAKEFWRYNQVTRIEDIEMKKCEHKFKLVPGGAECKKCHFGLIGPFEVRDEKLFHEGDPLGL